MNDPFTLVFDKLWDTVEAYPNIDTLIKVGNRLRLDDTGRRQLKETLASADTPELLLLPQSLSGSLHASSSGTRCVKQYSWIITTGDIRVNKQLFPLSWMLFSSMTRAMIDVLSLEWNNKKFVKRFDLVSSSDGRSEAQRESNIGGWSTIQVVEAEFHFTTSDLIAAATP